VLDEAAVAGDLDLAERVGIQETVVPCSRGRGCRAPGGDLRVEPGGLIQDDQARMVQQGLRGPMPEHSTKTRAAAARRAAQATRSSSSGTRRWIYSGCVINRACRVRVVAISQSWKRKCSGRIRRGTLGLAEEPPNRQHSPQVKRDQARSILTEVVFPARSAKPNTSPGSTVGVRSAATVFSQTLPEPGLDGG
jgi:hypothetical protein